MEDRCSHWQAFTTFCLYALWTLANGNAEVSLTDLHLGTPFYPPSFAFVVFPLGSNEVPSSDAGCVCMYSKGDTVTMHPVLNLCPSVRLHGLQSELTQLMLKSPSMVDVWQATHRGRAHLLAEPELHSRGDHWCLRSLSPWLPTAVFPIPSEGRLVSQVLKQIPHWNVEKLEHTGKNEALHSNWQGMKMASWNWCVYHIPRRDGCTGNSKAHPCFSDGKKKNHRSTKEESLADT